jgi:hypothetical protein
LYLSWDKVEKYDRAGESTDDNIIRQMCFACWITETTDTNSEYVIFLASSRLKLLCESASILLVHYIVNIAQNLITFYWLKCDLVSNVEITYLCTGNRKTLRKKQPLAMSKCDRRSVGKATYATSSSVVTATSES